MAADEQWELTGKGRDAIDAAITRFQAGEDLDEIADSLRLPLKGLQALFVLAAQETY